MENLVTHPRYVEFVVPLRYQLCTPLTGTSLCIWWLALGTVLALGEQTNQ